MCMAYVHSHMKNGSSCMCSKGNHSSSHKSNILPNNQNGLASGNTSQHNMSSCPVRRVHCNGSIVRVHRRSYNLPAHDCVLSNYQRKTPNSSNMFALKNQLFTFVELETKAPSWVCE